MFEVYLSVSCKYDRSYSFTADARMIRRRLLQPEIAATSFTISDSKETKTHKNSSGKDHSMIKEVNSIGILSGIKAAPSNRPIMLTGPPGCGRSVTLRNALKEW